MSSGDIVFRAESDMLRSGKGVVMLRLESKRGDGSLPRPKKNAIRFPWKPG